MAAPRIRLERTMLAGGVLAALLLAWVSTSPPPGRPASPLRLLWTLDVAAMSLAWSAVIGALLRVAVPRGRGRGPLRPAAAIVWLGAATIALHFFLPLGMLAGAILVTGAVGLLYTPSTILPGSALPRALVVPAAGDDIGAGAMPADPRSRHLGAAILAAVAAQAGASLVAARQPLLGGALVALSLALCTAAAISLGAWRRKGEPDPRLAFGVLAFAVLAAVVAGRITHLRGAPGDSMTASAAAMPVPPDVARGHEDDPPPMPGLEVPGGFSGVILWPEIRPVTLLVAPVPLRGGAMVASRPLAIPFGGEYWMFRRPYQRPPRGSFFRRGTPQKLSFSTTDGAPLQMEARHKLEQSVAVSCCSRLEVDVWNADRFPGTVTLGAMLVGHEDLGDGVRFTREQSLGWAPVVSSPAPPVGDDAPVAVKETLVFRFPPSPRLREFDEFRLVFHMAVARARRSARIAIDRFVLVPAGSP